MTDLDKSKYHASIKLACSKYIESKCDYIQFAQFITSNLAQRLGLEYIKWKFEDIIYAGDEWRCELCNRSYSNCVFIDFIQIDPPMIYISIYTDDLEKIQENSYKNIFDCIGEFEIDNKKFTISSVNNTKNYKDIIRFSIRNEDKTSVIDYVKLDI